MEGNGPSVADREINGDGKIQFESPIFLAPDQNLFDQSPFNELLTDVLRSLPVTKTPSGTDITVDMVRTVFASIVKRRQNGELIDKTPSELMELFLKSPSYDKLIQTNSISQSVKLLVGQAMRQQLPTYSKDYPLLAEYVDRNLAERRFSVNGSPNNVNLTKLTSPTTGYGEWLVQRQRNDSRLKQAAVIEVLGEAFNQDPLSVINTTGSTVVNKRYRLVKATEI